MVRTPLLCTALCAAICAVPGAAQDAVADTAAPCAAAAHRQFDFWIGSWEVTTPDGGLAGRSTVRSTLGGCVVHERWEGTRGMDGESFNVYDAVSGMWRQTWVDSRGGVILMEGGLEDVRMVLTVRHSTWWEGKPRLERWSWSAVDRDHVRQHAEISEDGGRTWKTMFDGRYARR